MPDKPRTPKERREYGRSLREKTPRESHAEWSPAPGRPDPVALLEGQNANRIPWLLPVRRARMAASPFAFYRGGARIVAADLARTPVSGITTQICGDAHLANFGAYASPERRLVFDLNDFDETLPGPLEWDVKRLAASFIIAGRHNGLSKKQSRDIARQTVRTYCAAMEMLAAMRTTDIWYSMVEVDRVRDAVEAKGVRADVGKAINKAKRKDSRHAMFRLTEQVGGTYRIRSEPPLLVPIRHIPDASLGDEIRRTSLDNLKGYMRNLPDHLDTILRKYRPVDFAIKVVGVGSVGTRCYILLLEGRDHDDPLFLQIKQASESVLEEHLPKSRYRNAGRRVIEGQHLMQTVSDIFLGWSTGSTTGNHYYWRQLKDWKFSADVDNATRNNLEGFASLRGWTLARAHARTGDPIAISGYLGSGKTFSRAMVEFAERYADQNELDYRAFAGEIERGRLEAAELAP